MSVGTRPHGSGGGHQYSCFVWRFMHKLSQNSNLNLNLTLTKKLTKTKNKKRRKKTNAQDLNCKICVQLLLNDCAKPHSLLNLCFFPLSWHTRSPLVPRRAPKRDLLLSRVNECLPVMSSASGAGCTRCGKERPSLCRCEKSQHGGYFSGLFLNIIFVSAASMKL